MKELIKLKSLKLEFLLIIKKCLNRNLINVLLSCLLYYHILSIALKVWDDKLVKWKSLIKS